MARKDVAAMADDVSYPVDAYQVMRAYWKKIAALKNGTEGMRAAGELFLPREDAESLKAYKARLNKSFLYEAYSDTVRKILSKPFSRKIDFDGWTPEQREAFAWIQNDVDRTGKDVDLWTEEVFEAAIDFGLTHVLIDYPQLPPGATLADENRAGARPAWIHVPPDQLIGWQYTGRGDNARLTQVRIYEVQKEKFGAFGERDVEYVRVITDQDFQVFKRDEGGSWVPESDPIPHTFREVPLLTVYFNRTGFMTGRPTLNGLANLNVEHWQSASDQRTVLSVARFGFLFAKGMNDTQVKDGIIIGPKRVIATENENADMKFVEHTGAAISAGERDLQQLQLRMEVLGLQPFIQRSGVETATSKLVHESKTESSIYTWINRTETLLTRCIEFSARWKGETPPDVKVDIFSDFAIAMGSNDEKRLLLEMWSSGAIDLNTLLQELKRRGLLAESLDLDKVVKLVEEEVRLDTKKQEQQEKDDGGEPNPGE